MVDVRGPVAVVTLNRPEKLNALTMAMRRRLGEVVEGLAADDGVRVVVLAGAGPRAFCAGADLTELGGRTLDSELAPEADLRRRLPRLLETIDKPTIAALHGHVLGAGLELAMACTIRVAASDARLGLPEVKRGVIPGSGGTQRLQRLCGLGWTLDLVLSGRSLSAAEASQIGLVTRVVPEGQAVAAAVALAQEMAVLSPRTLGLAKRAVLDEGLRGLDEGIARERYLFALALANHDAR